MGTRLAVDGGAKVRTTPLPPRLLFGQEEKQAVGRLFDRAMVEGAGVLGYNGPEEEAYCRQFADMLGGGYADAVNSGSNAIWVALRALELEPYAEVIVPPVSDAGGIMPVPLCNLIPVPADAAPGSYNTGAEQVGARLSPRTRAVLVAHIAGIPVDFDPILELARARDLPVIEDCAQSHGALYKGRQVGSLGTIATFSTMFLKHHATGGQGGVVFTKQEDLAWRIRRHADRGKPFGLTQSTGAGAGVGGATSLGGNLVAALNCNMDELHACIGREQLKKLPAMIERRRQLAQQIAEGCVGLRGVRLVGDPPGCRGSYWFIFLHFDASAYRVDKQTFVRALAAEGLPFEGTYLFVPTRQPWCREGRVFGDSLPWSAAGMSSETPPLPNVAATDRSHFRLPMHEGWGPQEVADILAALEKVDRAYCR